MAEKKVVLVTGSSSGFGRLTVETLARQGHSVFAGIRESADRNHAVATELSQLAERQNLALSVVDLDVTDEASVERAVQEVIAKAGRLDVVVNNAGLLSVGPLEAFTDEQSRQIFDTNVFGALRLNRAALPQMRKQAGGLLIQVSSVLGRQAFPFTGTYSATKFALEGLTEAWRHELAAFGIEAVVVEPDGYPTKGALNGLPAADAGRVPPYASFMEHFGKFLGAALEGGDPQEVADAIADVIATPAGQRPLRVLVSASGLREGITAINSVTEQISAATVEAAGWTSFTTFNSAQA